MSFLSSRNLAETDCQESFIEKLAVVKNCLYNKSTIVGVNLPR